MTFKTLLEYIKKNYIITTCVVVTVVCLVANLIRSEQIERLEADYDDLSVRRSRILKNLKFSAEIEKDLSEMKEMLTDSESRLLSSEDLAANQRYFYQIESSTGVDMKSIQQILKPLPTGKKNKKARKAAQRSKFQEIIYDITLQGSYSDTLAFLREIEGGRSFAVVEAISVASAKANADGPKVVTRLSVNVFGRKS